jgi:formylglycine-generating enzyme required for sulfatase activity
MGDEGETKTKVEERTFRYDDDDEYWYYARNYKTPIYTTIYENVPYTVYKGKQDERPMHVVQIALTKDYDGNYSYGDFYMGKYEVTQKQWKAVMGSQNNPSHFIGDNLPVENVSWKSVQVFIEKLNRLINPSHHYEIHSFRLPTEAEWEFCAMGGNNSKGYKYSGSNNIQEVAWHKDGFCNETHPVGEKYPNELGLYDMSGNVFEWCSDWYGKYNVETFYFKGKEKEWSVNPKGVSSGKFKVSRGGCYATATNDSCYLRVKARCYNKPDNAYNFIGFRLAHD